MKLCCDGKSMSSVWHTGLGYCTFKFRKCASESFEQHCTTDTIVKLVNDHSCSFVLYSLSIVCHELCFFLQNENIESCGQNDYVPT